MRNARRIGAGLALCLVLGVAQAAPALGAADPVGPAPDAFMSSNVEYLGSLKQDAGLTTGAKVLGDRLFVTSARNISIYDISNPAAPKQIGNLEAHLAWENEEVPTNGRVLGFASNFASAGTTGCGGGIATAGGAVFEKFGEQVPEVNALAAPLEGWLGCIQFFDVRDPANIRQVASLPAASHTVECALDCDYFLGSNGQVIDARGILEGKAPTVVGNWKAAAADQGATQASCHHIRELRPGVLLTSCRPFTVISINGSDGGSPATPRVLATGEAAEFVHSARWPNRGTDDLIMIGGEENSGARCENNTSEFSTYSAKEVLAGSTTEFRGPLDQAVPPDNGVYADGAAPAGALGCSVHWFQEHPSFKDGGLVAISEYENGVRFLQVGKDGKITEQGYFISIGSSSSAPHWACSPSAPSRPPHTPGGRPSRCKDNVLYSIDYQRGIDIMRYKGKHYVPGQDDGPGRVEGTDGAQPRIPALTKTQEGKRAALAERVAVAGYSLGLCKLTSE